MTPYTMLMLQTGAGSTAQPGSRATPARPHGARPPAGLALGRLGAAQQRGALARGEGGRLGAVTQQFRVRAPSARAGEAAGIDQAVGDSVDQHGALLKQARPARHGRRAGVDRNRQASRLPFPGCPTPAEEAPGLAGARRAGVSPSRRTGPPAGRVGRGGAPRPSARRRSSAARAGAAAVRPCFRGCRPRRRAMPCGRGGRAWRWP